MGNKIRLTIFLEATKLLRLGFKGFLGSLDRPLLNKKIKRTLRKLTVQLKLMAKQNLDFNHYEQAVRFLNQAREAMRGSNSSFSLENFESENTRINDEYYAYDGGFMAHVYLWHLNQDNFKKLMIDFYSIFAEKYKLNPTDGWKDAFEETFGLSLEGFYSDFDAFMRLDKESQVAIIKSADEWINSSWN